MVLDIMLQRKLMYGFKLLFSSNNPISSFLCPSDAFSQLSKITDFCVKHQTCISVI